MVRALAAASVLLLADAAPLRSHAAEAPTREAAVAALAKATTYLTSLATEGGYLWKYSADLKERAGEKEATPTQIWIQPPGTPTVGMAFVRAFEVTGDLRHLQAARAAGEALQRGQLESGGWAYLVDFDATAATRSYRRSERGTLSSDQSRRRDNVTVFDDDTTQSAVRFLLSLVDATRHVRGQKDPRDARAHEALEHALAAMLRAQYPNGAWPQRYSGRPVDPAAHPDLPARMPESWPRTWPREDYRAHYTLNDDSLRTCITTMLDAHRRTGRAVYLQAARRAGDFLIRAQLPAAQAGWAQQYNARMEPAWARAFEPPAVSSRESVGAMHALMDVFAATGDKKYLRPLPAAISWLKASALEPGRWARLYELGTNKPIYGDRDGKVYERLEDLSEERRTGYGWQGGFGVERAIAEHERLAAGAQARPPAARKPAEVAARAARAVSTQDAQGRWLSNGRLEMRVFVEHMEALAAHLSVPVSPRNSEK